MDKYSTLDTIIRQLLLEQGETTERRYPAMLSYGYAFLNGEYPVGAGGGTVLKTTLVDVGADRVADLPEDYMEFVSLGRIYGDKVRNLAYNASLVPEGLSQPPAAGVIGYGNVGFAPAAGWPVFSYWGWEELGLSGWDGRGFGWGEWGDEFAIDREERTIRLSSALGGYEAGPLLLQYHSNNLSPGKPTPIHPYWQQALKEWMLWQWYSKAKENFQAAGLHKAEYYAQRAKAMRRTDPVNIYDEIVKQLAANYNSLR